MAFLPRDAILQPGIFYGHVSATFLPKPVNVSLYNVARYTSDSSFLTPKILVGLKPILTPGH